jgi:hypothetical protein
VGSRVSHFAQIPLIAKQVCSRKIKVKSKFSAAMVGNMHKLFFVCSQTRGFALDMTSGYDRNFNSNNISLFMTCHCTVPAKEVQDEGRPV